MTSPRQHLRDCQNIYTHRSPQKDPTAKAYTSFGSLKDARQTSAPKYSFGRSTREKQPKRYLSKEITKVDNYGISTPQGPDYTVSDKFAYKKSPEWKMNTTPRLKLNTEAQYQYYHMIDNLEVGQTNRKVKPRSSNATFGHSRRFEKQRSKSPGPAYHPGIQPQQKKEPAYSITMKRNLKGQDPIEIVNGTDQFVGPGKYITQQNIYTSRRSNEPKWTMPRSQRNQYSSSTSLHQTYDVTSSIGVQLTSQKPSKPKYTIHGSRRSNSPGILKTELQFQPMKVNIPHPTF